MDRCRFPSADSEVDWFSTFGKIVGLTSDGDPIIAFQNDPGDLYVVSNNMTLNGQTVSTTTTGNLPVLLCRRDDDCNRSGGAGG